MLRDRRAVSPAVGVVLMVAITIVLAATIYLWISSMKPQETTPSATMSFKVDVVEVGNYDVLKITVITSPHNLKWSQIEFIIDSQKLIYNNNEEVEAGDTVYIYKDSEGLKLATSLTEVQQNVASDFATGTVTLKVVDAKSNVVIFEKEMILS